MRQLLTLALLGAALGGASPAQSATQTIRRCSEEVARYTPEVVPLFQLEGAAHFHDQPLSKSRRLPGGGLLLEDKSGGLRAYDAKGRLSITYEDGGVERSRAAATLEVALDGRIYRTRSRLQRVLDELDPTGARIASLEFKAPLLRCGPFPRTFWTSDWTNDGTKIALVSESGRPYFSTALRPDGAPIRTVLASCTLPDGALLFVEGPGSHVEVDDARTAAPTALCKLGGSGDALWILPSLYSPGALECSGRWAVLAWPKGRTGTFVLVDLEGARLTIPRLPQELARRDLLGLHFAPDGEALWWIQDRTLQVFRISLP